MMAQSVSQHHPSKATHAPEYLCLQEPNLVEVSTAVQLRTDGALDKTAPTNCDLVRTSGY